MKIDIEVKVQGAVSGIQADTSLMFTKGVSAKNTVFLDKIDDPNPVDHSSLCMFKSAYNGKYIVAHWQTGFESFPQNGRFYCTRAIYEIDAKDVERADYSSLISAMPQLVHFTDKKFDVDPLTVEVAENKEISSAPQNSLLKYIWIAIAAGKRLFIKLDKSEDSYANALLESRRLHALLCALNQLPLPVRSAASFAYSLKAADAAKISDPVFGELGIVAYYPDSLFSNVNTDAITVIWNGSVLTEAVDYSGYAKEAEELKGVSAVLDEQARFATWKDMCVGLVQAKASVDNALQTKNYDFLNAVVAKSCLYRKQEVLKCLLERLASSNCPTVKDVQFLAAYAAKNDGLDACLEKWLKSGSVSLDVKLEIQNVFGGRQRVADVIAEMSGSLPLKERFSRFGTSLCRLTYQDLALDKATDNEFFEIYIRLQAGEFKKVDVNKIPGSDSFPARYVRLVVARNSNAIVCDKKFRSFVCQNNVADDKLLDWLFAKKYINTPEQLAAWSLCLDKYLLIGLVARYIEANSKTLTCVDLLKLMYGTKLGFAYADYLAENNLALCDLAAYCRDLSATQKDEIYTMLSGRRLSTLADWEQMQDAFGKSSGVLTEDFFRDIKSGTINLKEIIRVYAKYSQLEVRDYLEHTVLAIAANYPDDRRAKSALKEMEHINKDFKRRMSQMRKTSMEEFMFSPRGAKIAWGLSALLLIVILIMAVTGGQVSDTPTQGIPGYMPADISIVGQDTVLNMSPADSLADDFNR